MQNFNTARFVLCLLLIQSCAAAQEPIVNEQVVFAEENGLLAVEAEHFFKQTSTSKRAFYLTHNKLSPQIAPDGDPVHVAGASGGAYLEVLPDTRRTHADKLIKGTNFSPEPGKMAVLHYKVNITKTGRYYVWVRAHSTGSEDNGLHVGLDGTWPASGQRLQWCQGKKSWRWESKQRTEKVHCGEPHLIYLDIEKAGLHTIHFSMREDGFEFDKWLMTTDKKLPRPDGIGPKSAIHAGQPPKSFTYVEAAASSATAASAQKPDRVKQLRILPQQLDIKGTGYYLDRGKWLAVNPERNKQGKVQTAFPFPSGKYDLTLLAVGEEDGQSTYSVSVGDELVGEFTCPLSDQMFEEGEKFNRTWKNLDLSSGDVITLSSAIASADGEEFSRARIAGLRFTAANQKTLSVIAKLQDTPTNKMPAGPPLVLPRKSDGTGQVTISENPLQWYKTTLTLDGPFAHELDNRPNPFTDMAMQVTFAHESGAPTFSVPGYFAADGNAKESSAKMGTKWRAHLSADKTGTWTYKIEFRKGKHVALDGGGSPLAPFDGLSGSFVVAAADAPTGFYAHGRLKVTGGHYLQFAQSKQHFLKAGPDAPETLLAFVDFDDTVAGKAAKVPLKTWQPHQQDWRSGDPSWKGGKGKNLIGALNYLADQGLNAFSFLTYNAGGDGDNVWPFVSRDDKLHYDCSKLDQWGVVFDHATSKGLYLHFKLQETEIDDNRRGQKIGSGSVPESLDGGELGPQRKLYCRELIARYAHALALNWNIGEENTQSPAEIKDMVKYIQDTDPYGHLVVIHTYPNQQDKVYSQLLGDQSTLTGASLQNSWSAAHQRTLKWREASAAAGRPWVVANDEQNPASAGVPADPGYEGSDGTAIEGKRRYDTDDIRKSCLWGTLLAGGAGVEYYFGYKLPQNDLICQDFRSRELSWKYCRIALEFFKDYEIPFSDMENADELIGNSKHDNSKYCFAKLGEVYLVYLPNGGPSRLDLKGGEGTFRVHWFNPREGGKLLQGPVKTIKAGDSVSLGAPPAEGEQDWLVLIRKE